MTARSRDIAPPVSYPAGFSVWAAVWACGLAMLALIVILAGVWWGADASVHPQAKVASLVGLGLWGVAVLCLWAPWRSRVRGALRWQEGRWSWNDDAGRGDAVEVQVVLAQDLQARLLLRLRAVNAERGVPAWLWLERRSEPVRWPDLRRAVWATRDGHAPPS